MSAPNKWRNPPSVLKAAVPVGAVTAGAVMVAANSDAAAAGFAGGAAAVAVVVSTAVVAGKKLAEIERVRRQDNNKMHLPWLAALDKGLRDVDAYKEAAERHRKLAEGATKAADKLADRQAKYRDRQKDSDRAPSKFRVRGRAARRPDRAAEGLRRHLHSTSQTRRSRGVERRADRARSTRDRCR